MTRYAFQLRISPEAYLDYYRGRARAVVVTTDDGTSLQFPASFLLKFVTGAGIDGRFEILCDANHKCVEMKRLAR